MCGPAAIPLAIASAVVTAGGTMLSAVGQSQQYRASARIDDANAKIASAQTLDSIQNTNLEALQLSRKHSAVAGQQVAAMAANGVDLSFGSAVAVQEDTAMLAAEDRAQLYKEGAARTLNFDREAWNWRGRAASDRAKASGAITAGILSSLGTALGSASQISGMQGGKAPGSGSLAVGTRGNL